MLGFLRSASSSSLDGKAAAPSADPDHRGSLDLSLDEDRDQAQDSGEGEGEVSLRFSEDGDLSELASRSVAHSSPAPSRLTPGSVLDAVRDQHPNFSVFRPSFTDKLASPVTAAKLVGGEGLATQGLTHTGEEAPGTTLSPDVPTSTTPTAATTLASPSETALETDSPSVKALQSKQVFMLKSKRRRSAEASGTLSGAEENSDGASGFLIQGLRQSPDISSSSASSPKGMPSRTHAATPALARVLSEARPSTPDNHSPYPAHLLATPDASVKGILRLPRTPGTGSSVRFGKRLYDDGDESAVSASVDNSPEQSRSSESRSAGWPSPAVASYETDEERAARAAEEADVDWSLSFGTRQKRDAVGLADGPSLMSSPHSQLSLSSLNDSPDHDQIQAIRDLSTSTEEGGDEEGNDSISISFNDSDSGISQSSRSRLPSSSPTVRIPMARAVPASPLGRDRMMPPTSSFEQDQSLQTISAPAAAEHEQRPDASGSRILGLSTAFGDQTNEASDLIDLSMDSMRRINYSRSLANLDEVRAAGRSRHRSGDREGGDARVAKSSIDSMPSSGSYDSSEASFSESFLREAGAGMLAGLDFDYVETGQGSQKDAGSESMSEDDPDRSAFAPADALSMETPRFKRFAELPAAVETVQSLHTLDEVSDAEEDTETEDLEADAIAMEMDDMQASLDPGTSSVTDAVEAGVEDDIVSPSDPGSSPPSSSPNKHSAFSNSSPKASTTTTPVKQQAAVEVTSAPASKDGSKAFLPSPTTPSTTATPTILSSLTPGDLSLATTAADWATPQWSGPTPSPHSPNTRHPEESIDQSVSWSATASSPTREKLARKTGDMGRSRSPYASGQMVLQPDKQADRAAHLATPGQHHDPATASATADLEEIVAVVQQLDQAHTERGSYLVSRVQQAEAKFALLSQALKQESDEKERVLRENKVARDKVQALQDKISGILEEFEASKQQSRAKDGELEQLVLKLNGQLERRQRDKETQVRSEELQRQLDNERRARASERQDWEVRLSSALKDRDSAATAAAEPLTAALAEAERQRLIQETREQTRDSCRRDFEIRTEIAQRESQQEIERLQAFLDKELSAQAPADTQRHEPAAQQATLQAQTQVAEELREELEVTRAQQNHESRKLLEQISELEDQLHDARHEAEKVEMNLCNSEQRQAEVEVRAAALQSDLESRTLELQQCQQLFDQAERNHTSVQAELEQARNVMQQRDEEVHSLRLELQGSRSAADQAFEEKRSILTYEVSQLRADCQASASLANELRVEKGQVETMLDQANEQRKNDLEAIARLRLDLDEAGRERQDVLVSLTELEGFHAQEQTKLQEVQAQLLKLSEEKESLIAQHHEAEAIRDDKLRHLSAQLEAVSIELDASHTQLEVNAQVSAEHQALQEELTRLRARIASLEHEVADRGLTIVKLTKTKDTLEDENTNYGIALSAKQLELSMLKRNARIALGEGASTPRTTAGNTNAAVVSGSRTTTALGSAQRSVLGSLSGNSLASTGGLRQLNNGGNGRDDRLKATAEEEGEPVEAMTLQKGPAALKGHRRRTLDPATVIGVGRLRPRASISTSVKADALTPQQQRPAAPVEASKGGSAMPPPLSTSRVPPRRPSAVSLSDASSTTAVSVSASSTKVSAATQARINRRQSMAGSNSQASSASSSRAPSPAESTASSRRSSISSQTRGPGNKAPLSSSATAQQQQRRRSLASSTSVSAAHARRRTPTVASTRPSTSVAEDLSLSLSELQNVSTSASMSRDRRASNIHRRLSALPSPPSGEDDTCTPRASKATAGRVGIVRPSLAAASTTPPMPERMLLPV